MLHHCALAEAEGAGLAQYLPRSCAAALGCVTFWAGSLCVRLLCIFHACAKAFLLDSWALQSRAGLVLHRGRTLARRSLTYLAALLLP